MKLNTISTRIHSVETGGAVDGPGMRYVVFMQGCPLRCKFCHNPDTWNAKGGQPKNLSELWKDILKYKPFMQFSNGGITVSGGEPLLHKEFITFLFELAKQADIHTAIDTSGYTNIDDELDVLLTATDLVLLDIKHLDSDKHLDLTGVNNNKTLALLDHLRDLKINTWVRWVVLPGFNDSDEYAKRFADFIKDYDNVELVELLPYHEMGKYKWQEIGLKYELEGMSEPTKKDIQRIAAILHSQGIKTLGDY